MSKIVKNLTQASNRGFTLLEMVITVGIIAILISISTPAIFEFMRHRDYQNEEIAQVEIRKALQAYLADTGVLPTDTGTGNDAWYNLLAGYTSLSADAIANDVWGRPRSYIVYLNNSRRLFGNSVNVYYATVHSMGLSGNADTTYINTNGSDVVIPGLATTSAGGRTSFAGSTSSGWWKNMGTTADDRVSAFSALRPGGDDLMTRFTNYTEVLDRYNVTLQRMDKLTQALETSARSGYAERVSFCNTSSRTAALCDNSVPELTIYYPRSSPADSGETDTSAVYANTTVVVNNSRSDTLRRTDMQDLMNRLGLPAEFCCSALTNATDGQPMPFYYFSNPRPRTGTACGSRPGALATKLPARLTTRNVGPSSADRTCG